MPPLSALSFRITAQNAPFRSILYSETVLQSVLRNPAGTDTGAQAEAFAELLVRCHLNPRRLSDYRETLSRHAPVEVCAEFLSRCETGSIQPDIDTLLEPFHNLALPFQTALTRRFQAILSADGFIPVFQEESGYAFLLPFSFRDGPAVVEDWDGAEIPLWTAALEGIRDENRPGKTVRVAIQQNNPGFQSFSRIVLSRNRT